MRYMKFYRPTKNSRNDFDELLELTRENNQMLRWIMSYLMHEA